MMRTDNNVHNHPVTTITTYVEESLLPKLAYFSALKKVVLLIEKP